MLMAFDRRGWGRRGGLKPAAHTPRVPGGEWHDLATHLHATAAKAKARADKFGAGDLAYLAGLIHDYEKFNPAFQKYLRDAVAGRSAKRVQHAVHGALLARDSAVPWVMQPIYGHHSQMPSGNDIKEAFANAQSLPSEGRAAQLSAPVRSARCLRAADHGRSTLSKLGDDESPMNPSSERP